MTSGTEAAHSHRWAPVVLGVVAAIVVCVLRVSVASAAPLFPQCPPVGNNQGCSQLVVQNSNGTLTVKVDPAAPPNGYDGADDTLIGFLNSSSKSVSKIALASQTQDIFGFDGDGLCEPAQWPQAPPTTPPGCPTINASNGQGFGPTGYEGPDNTFSNISANVLTGEVDFTKPIAPNGSTYFALEEPLTAGQLLSGQAGKPITTTPIVSGTTVSFLLGCVFGNVNCVGSVELVLGGHFHGARIAKKSKSLVVGKLKLNVPAGTTDTIAVSLNKKGLKLVSKKGLKAELIVKLAGQTDKLGKVKFKKH